MNTTQVELTTLPADNLFGTEGVLTYTTYRRWFSGQFDAAGEPVFEDTWFRKTAPIVQRHEGQKFEGFWEPHNSLPFVVLDTGHLRLAFHCPAILRHPMSPLDPPRLRVEAVKVPDQNHAPSTAWRIFQYPTPKSEQPRWLSPGLDSPIALAPSNTGSRRLPLTEALACVAEEQKWLAEQRKELLPHPGVQLSPAMAREAACLDVLGSEYFRVTMAKQLWEKMLRAIDSGQPDPDFIIVQPVTRDEVVAAIERQAPDVARMAELSRHPKLQQIINDRTDWLLVRDQALQRRLGQLERLHATLNSQVAKVGHPPDQPALGVSAPAPGRSVQPQRTSHRGFRMKM